MQAIPPLAASNAAPLWAITVAIIVVAVALFLIFGPARRPPGTDDESQ